MTTDKHLKQLLDKQLAKETRRRALGLLFLTFSFLLFAAGFFFNHDETYYGMALFFVMIGLFVLFG